MRAQCREADELVAGALAVIASALGPRGQWPGQVRNEATGQLSRDIAAPLTALGVLALLGLPHPAAQQIVERSREHIVATARPGGLWRYYANIPPDTDDTAMCALALGATRPDLLAQTRVSLAGLRQPDGRFPTWFEPGWLAVVDPVACAHVCAVLGPGPTTAPAAVWITDVVTAGREGEQSAYYRDCLDLHLAITRAVAAGVADLRGAADLAGRRARDRLVGQTALTAYRAAQAMVVAGASGRIDPGAWHAGREVIIAGAEGAGWSAETLFVAGNAAGPGLQHYRSAAVVSALCARALTLPRP